MLIVVLGTMASGSTWIYNVVSGLLAATGQSAFRFASENGTHVLQHLPADGSCLLVKAHGLNRDFVALLAHADARVIVSRRDPRDVVVSQHDRFEHRVCDTVRELTASYSSIAMLPPGLRRLDLDYDTGFTSHAHTINAIADFLDLPITRPEASDIFETLQPDRVREKIRDRVDTYLPGSFVDHDPSSQWHPNHVGDGQIGKWKGRVEEGMASAIVSAVEAARMPTTSNEPARFWSSRLFHYSDSRSGVDNELIQCDADRISVFGPYYYLPAGRWRLEPVLRQEPGAAQVRVRLDVNLPREPERQVAWAVWQSSRAYDTPILEFDHRNHFEPIEVRVHIGYRRRGAFRFGGVRLNYLGPSEATTGPDAYPVQ